MSHKLFSIVFIVFIVFIAVLEVPNSSRVSEIANWQVIYRRRTSKESYLVAGASGRKVLKSSKGSEES